MGWASYLEDSLERLQSSVHSAQEWLSRAAHVTEDHRDAAIKALKDAQVLLQNAWNHLELATAPELDHALEISKLRREVRALKADLAAAHKELSKETTILGELRQAKDQISALKKENRKLEKRLDRFATADFAKAVEIYSSPELIKKHKPDS